MVTRLSNLNFLNELFVVTNLGLRAATVADPGYLSDVY